MEEPDPEITPRHHQALTLVNEKIAISGPNLAHVMYGNQSSLARVYELLARLIFSGLVEDYYSVTDRSRMFTCTEKGEQYLETTPRPVKPFAL